MGVPAGMYELTVSAQAEPVVSPRFGKLIPVPHQRLPFRIYIPREVDRNPRLHVGQRFLVFPEGPTRYRDEHGDEIDRREIVMHAATLQSIDRNEFAFAVDGSRRKIIIASAPPSHLPGLLALSEDDPVAHALNARYAGRKVWERGGIDVNCVGAVPGGIFSGGANGARPLTIQKIFRVARSAYELAIGHQLGASGGSRDSVFADEEPLLVRLDVPAGVFPAADGSQSCLVWYRFFSDAWDLQREYSVRSASEEHPDWPRHILDLIARDELEKGMTHEQVAWAFGYPAHYGAPPSIDALPAWRYDNLLPFSYWVYFDSHGTVRTFGPDGRLP
jgi:hypothetical protein